MAFLHSLLLIFALAILLCQSVYGRALPEPKAHLQSLERRDQVGACQAALVALKASAFCSSFNHISDVTKTVTSTGSARSTVLTVTGAPCTTTAPAVIVTKTNNVSGPISILTSTVTLSPATETASSTLAASTVHETATTTVTITTSSVTTGPAIIATSSIVTTASTLVTTTSTSTVTVTTSTTIPIKKRDASPRCSIRGLPAQIGPFACDVISQACSRFVQPRTSTVSTMIPATTITSTVTVPPACAKVTPTETISVSVTAAADLTTVYTTEIPPPIKTTVLNQLPPTTVTDSTTTVSVISTSTSVVTPTTTITTTVIDRTTTDFATVTTTTTATATICPQTTQVFKHPNPNWTLAYTAHACTQCGGWAAEEPLPYSPDFSTCMANCFAQPERTCVTVNYQRSTGKCVGFVGSYSENNPTPDSDYVCASA